MFKRIKIATKGFYPDGMAATYRIHCYAKGLQEKGIDVKVVSADSQKVHPGKTFGFKGHHEGIPFTILLNKRFTNSAATYIWAELKSYALFFNCLFTIRQYDVLWLYGMGLIPQMILIPILHLFGKKVIMEVNEYPYSTEGNKYTKIPVIRKFLQWGIFKLVIPQLDGIVAISESLRTVVNNHSPKLPVLKIPILADISNSDIRVDNRMHENPYIFHAGSLSIQKDGILNVIEAYALAATELRNNGIQLDLVLTNKMTLPHVWQSIEKILKDNNLSGNLVITGYLQDSELHAYLRHAAALLINKPPSLQNKYNFPTKLGDYLLSGRPVIVASEGGELNHFLHTGENSVIVKSDNIDEMAEALVLLCRDKEHAARIGNAGRLAAMDYFDYRKNADRIIDFINKL